MMNDMAKDGDLKGANDKRLVPELRFSEFKKEGEWEKIKLENIAEFYKGKGISKNDISNNGKTPCIRYGELYTFYKEIVRKVKSYTNLPIENLFFSKANDVIIPSSGETKEDISTASCILCDNIALGGDINVIRASHHNGVFLSYYLNNIKKNDISQIAQGASIIHLHNSQLQKLLITIPSTDEQQKIAGCLSSIDEEISAMKEKVEQLKIHKKGLMQKLFPVVGKFVPECRFPEFKKDREWKEELLGYCYKLKGGYAFKSSMFQNEGIPIIRISNIPTDSLFIDLSDCIYYKEIPNDETFIINKGDLLLAMSGATTGKTAIYKQNKTAYLNQRVGVFKSIKNTNSYLFLCQWVKTYNYEKQLSRLLTAGAQPNVSSNDIETLIFKYPQNTKEQQKIAECLSSMDELISLYENKVILMEQHKKGLMQRLFPKL